MKLVSGHVGQDGVNQIWVYSTDAHENFELHMLSFALAATSSPSRTASPDSHGQRQFPNLRAKQKDASAAEMLFLFSHVKLDKELLLGIFAERQHEQTLRGVVPSDTPKFRRLQPPTMLQAYRSRTSAPSLEKYQWSEQVKQSFHWLSSSYCPIQKHCLSEQPIMNSA